MGKNKSNKTGKKRELVKEIEKLEWQACTNRLIPSLSQKAYPLLKIKDLFGHKPCRPVPLKWTISTTGFSCEVVHIKEVVPSMVLVLQHNWTQQTNILLWSHYYFFSCLCNFSYDTNLVVVLSFSLKDPLFVLITSLLLLFYYIYMLQFSCNRFILSNNKCVPTITLL